MTKLKPLLPFLFFAAVAAVVIVELAPVIHPPSAISLQLDSDQIISRSEQILDELQADVSGYAANAMVRQNKMLVRQVEQMYGVKGSKR